MAINFPNTPSIGETFTSGDTTWKWNGDAWIITSSDFDVNQFTRIDADSGTLLATTPTSIVEIAGGDNVTTSISGNILTITSAGGGLTQNVFDTITADEGTTTAASINDTLNILGGTNISTAIATDTDNVTINLDAFSIDFLSDVDTTSSPPSTGQVLKWDGAKWAPGSDATTGGAGTDADTLDGFDSAYYLDYNNFTNVPTAATLTSFSVGIENAPSGNGAIEYNNVSGVFKYTPPTAAGIGALVSETNDLTAAVTWADVPDSNITESSVTQHQAALSITESQITDLGGFLSTTSIDALSDVDTTTSAPTDGQVLAWDNGNSVWAPTDAAAGGGGNAFSIISVSGQSNVEADASGDTLTIVAGNGISIATNPSTDTVTITSTVTGGADNFSALTDATNSGLTVDKIYMQAIARLVVDNVSSLAYTFDSHYSGNNPSIYALGGTTIAFDLDGIAGHPFEIQDPTSTPYNIGLVHVTSTGTVSTGSNAQGQTEGTLYWQIPENISGAYRYQCQSHAAMVGAINIKRLSVI